ncbi:MAG: sigma-70 family RNA polymerase sigma factor [Planctomycetota bacterium]
MNEQMQIIESLKRKDDAVITRVFQEHGAMVYNVCLGILKNSHAADDAAQATFIALVKRASRLSPSVNLAGWLYHAAVLASKIYREHESRLKARERKASEMKSFQSQSADETWEAIREALTVALDSLPVNQRNAIVLTHLEGKTRLEAAAVLGAPEGTVAAWIHRGLTKLKERLGAKNRDDRLSVAALGSLLLKHGTQAVPPESLLPSIIKTVTSGIASPTDGDATNGLFLSERVVSAMVWSKTKTYGGDRNCNPRFNRRRIWNCVCRPGNSVRHGCYRAGCRK